MQDICSNYFEWYDMEPDDRHGIVITHLNNRRLYFEEKIALLEERIMQLEAKLATKKREKSLEGSTKEVYKKILLLYYSFRGFNDDEFIEEC